MEGLAKAGMTMMLVTHETDFSARRVAHVTIFMHKGKVWESGPPNGCSQTPERRAVPWRAG